MQCTELLLLGYVGAVYRVVTVRAVTAVVTVCCRNMRDVKPCRLASSFCPDYSTLKKKAVCSDMIYDIFANCNCVATRRQQYSTQLHTNSTQNNTM